MRSSRFYTFLDDEDRIIVERGELRIAQVTIYLSNKQLLDLGMKIQSVINEIDRENREPMPVFNDEIAGFSESQAMNEAE